MKKRFAVLLACGLMTGLTAQAREVTFTGEKCPLNIVSVRGNEEEADDRFEVEVESVDFLGTIDGNEAAVRYEQDGEVVYALASLEDAMGKVPSLDFSALPKVENWSDVGIGASGDMARAIQQAFVDISVMGEDQVDGIYGEGTAEVVSAFQADNKLQPTGKVDVYTWFLLRELKDAPTPITAAYPPVFDAKVKFSSIYDHVADPEMLESFTDPAWRLRYDPFEGMGELTLGEGVHVGTWSDESSQIDKLQMDVDLIVFVYADEEGVVSLVPAFKVSSVGSCRPYVESIAVKSGNEVTNMPVLFCDGAIDGTEMTETAIVPVTKAITGDGVLRIKGSNREYEMEFKVGRDFSKFAVDGESAE